MLCWFMAGLYTRPLIEGRKCDDDFQVRNLLLQGYKALGSLSLLGSFRQGAKKEMSRLILQRYCCMDMLRWHLFEDYT